MYLGRARPVPGRSWAEPQIALHVRPQAARLVARPIVREGARLHGRDD